MKNQAEAVRQVLLLKSFLLLYELCLVNEKYWSLKREHLKFVRKLQGKEYIEKNEVFLKLKINKNSELFYSLSLFFSLKFFGNQCFRRFFFFPVILNIPTLVNKLPKNITWALTHSSIVLPNCRAVPGLLWPV